MQIKQGRGHLHKPPQDPWDLETLLFCFLRHKSRETARATGLLHPQVVRNAALVRRGRKEDEHKTNGTAPPTSVRQPSFVFQPNRWTLPKLYSPGVSTVLCSCQLYDDDIFFHTTPAVSHLCCSVQCCAVY